SFRLPGEMSYEVNIALGFRDSIEIFGHHGFSAVWDSVLAKVARPQSCGDDFHSPALGSDLSSEAAVETFGRQSESSVEFPRCFGNSLPRSILLLRSAEVEQPRLRSSIGFQLQSLVILPGNMQPCRNSHDVRGAIAFALLAGGLVLRRIPAVGNAPGFLV